jgi:hypothetical protein
MIDNPADTSSFPELRTNQTQTASSGRTDAVLLILTGMFVGGLALVAGAISFAHMAQLAAAHGQTGWKSSAFPISVDGLELVASLYILARHRARCPAGPLPWTALLVGTAASLTANIAVGGHDSVGRALAGWPAISLLVSIKLLFSMFDHTTHDLRTVDQRTVRDDQRILPDRPPTHQAVPDARPDDGPDDPFPSATTRPSATSGGRGPGPAGAGTPSTLGSHNGPLTPLGAGRGGAATGLRDVADLIPAARTARAALTAAGRRLTRDALADRMRGAGHRMSNARVCLLVKVLRAEYTMTTDTAATRDPGVAASPANAPPRGDPTHLPIQRRSAAEVRPAEPTRPMV